jgi:hypothetical protein
LRLSDGTSYEVSHPELAFVARSIVMLHLPAPQYPPALGHRREIIVLNHIVRIEFIEQAGSTSTN